jgi:tagaturonate epimerase
MNITKAFKMLTGNLKSRYVIYDNSLHSINANHGLFLLRDKSQKIFGEINTKKNFIFKGLYENVIEFNFENELFYLGLFDASIGNSKELIPIFSYLKPSIMDKKISVGFGDRIGIASPAHVKISRDYDFFPVFTQQSAREITKTSRDCETVLHNSVMGIFQEGYGGSWGADADHLREEKWLNIMLDNTYVPYTMFTIDTYDYINLEENLSNLYLEDIKFKERLNKAKKYIGKSFNFAGYKLTYTEDNIYSIVGRYYRSLDFLLNCFNLIKNKIKKFDFEPTFDEREIDTTPLEHFYLASELINDGITFSTFAPKFPGLFEKGIDYIGDLDNFISELKIHGEIAGYFGNYRLSFHSADDKFKIFKYFREILGDNFHVKTSGTTWMESLRTVAEFNPDLFKRIINMILEKAEENSQDYHITLDYNRINNYINNKRPVDLIDIKETRQFLHVSYGTVINEYRNEILATLYSHEEDYMKNITRNYKNHFKSIFGK